jgi:uncharacterized protein (DUF58 family)
MLTTSEILKKVRHIEIRTGRLVTETFAGEYHSVFKGQGIEFSEVREYFPGDEVRSIDWNVSARLGKPYVKRFSEERELTMMIACDVSASQNFGSREKLKSEIAAELTALFAFSALKNNDKVGLMLFSDEVELFIPPRKGRKHVLRMIRELIAFKPKSKKTDIGVCLDSINRMIKRKGILILMSDFKSENFEKSLKLSAKKHDLIPIYIEDPLDEKLFRTPALLQVEDPETGVIETIDLSSSYVRENFSDKAKQQNARLKQLFKKTQSDWIHIRSDRDISDPVIRFFKERERRFRY